VNQKQIRDNCYDCGNRKKLYIDGGQFATDYCRAAHQECSKIKLCDPAVRIPKDPAAPKKKEGVTLHEADFPLPEDTIPVEDGE